jgi:4-hydroxybenzoyl-CoA reductase subunit beta
MLRLAQLEVLEPRTWAEAVRLLQQNPEARVLAGGTDLLPAMKTRQIRSRLLVSLRHLLDGQIFLEGDQLHLDAGVTLTDLANHPLVLAGAPALARAASLVASPLVRNRATLAGNLCVEPRCRYINQSELFRQALGGCLKSHGNVCHVVPAGTRCVAALSSDTAPVLIAYQATIHTIGPQGRRIIPAREFHRADGLHPNGLQAAELIRQIRLPSLPPGCRVTYRKWRPRKSIDFPLVSVALRLDTRQGYLDSGSLVVGVLGPKPRVISLDPLAGAALNSDLPLRIAELAQSIKPLPNVPYDPDYRKTRLLLEVQRAVREML